MKIQRISPRGLIKAFLVFTICALHLGWVRPQVPTKLKPVTGFSAQLQQMTFEINGALHTVKNGETLRAVRGDRVKVVGGLLNEAARKIETINVIGYSHVKSRDGDDRGREFSTFDLLERWSENKDGNTYAVIASSGKDTHGYVFLSLIEPELKFAVLDVNGREVVLRDGEPFVGAGTDKVRVKRVSTNVSGNENVFVQMVPVKGRDGEYEMRFLREKLIFARLPMKLEK